MTISLTKQNPSTNRPPGGVTVIPPPDEPSAKKWIEENPVVTAVIAVGVLFLIIFIIFYCIRKRRKAAEAKVNLNEENPTPEPPPPQQNNNAPEDLLPESFVIIQSPNLHGHRMHQKRKSTLAVPPLFSVSNKHRRSAPSSSHELKPPVVGWTRWSTAGLEIHTPPTGDQENQLPKGYAKKKRQSMPGIMMAVPVVYRRVSHGHLHSVHAEERPSPPPRPSTP